MQLGKNAEGIRHRRNIRILYNKSTTNERGKVVSFKSYNKVAILALFCFVCCVVFVCVFWNRELTLYLKLALNSLCSRGWSSHHGELPERWNYKHEFPCPPFIFTGFIQHSSRIPSQSNQAEEREKWDINWKREVNLVWFEDLILSY